jgi:HPt (histidine-containing phosphotransfer) domain-containing protein
VENQTVNVINANNPFTGLKIMLATRNASCCGALVSYFYFWNINWVEVENALAVPNMLEEAASRGNPFDAIFLDMEIPDMNIAAIIGSIQMSPQLHRAKVVTISCLESGFGDQPSLPGVSFTLKQPVEPATLFDCLAILLPAAPNAVSLDQSSLDELKLIEQNGSPGFFAKMISLYFKQAADIISTLRKAMSAGDTKTLQRNAHSFKSISATVGAISLSELCKRLEIIVKNGELSNLRAYIPAIELEYEQARRALEKQLASALA